MNITTLNTTTLDGNVIIKKGGGGVTINNQDKVVDITENGTTEVVADSGYTGLGKVTINTEGANSYSITTPICPNNKNVTIMWKRIQTLYLLISTGLIISMLFSRFASIIAP